MAQVLQTDQSESPMVLLVDDYEANIMIASLYLDSFGYSYDIARSGKEALEKVKHNQYAAVLMDIQMPELDGIETTRLIRELEAEHGRTPQTIIALTAHPMSGNPSSCRSAGMDWYMAKPFNPDELKVVLQKCIDA